MANIDLINDTILNDVDLSDLGLLINEVEFLNYFKLNCGAEHYKLLAYFSTLYNNQTLIDVGTFKGCSALAMSYNKTNTVVSFDIKNSLNLKKTPNNIQFKIDNILNGKYDDLILKSPFILLDTLHDGIFENEFYEFLVKNKYKGMLMLDDINLNKEMTLFWKSISCKKIDVTNYGHHSGTGIVIF